MSGFFVSTANALTTLTVTSPNGAEEWRGIQNITWTSTGGAPDDLVDIVYSTDAFSSQAVVATGVLNNAGSYSWDTTSFPESGTYLVRFLSNPGALVYDTSNNVFMVDNTAPVTALATTTGTLGLNSYYMGPSVPTFSLNCTDALSGCFKTYYRWDAGAFVDNSVTPVTVMQGVHTLEWYSEDQAVDAGGFHNTEATHSQVIKVDTIVPTVAVTSTTADGAYNVPDAINATLTFNEAVTTTDTITVTLETGATDRTCIVPIMTNATVGTCTYTVQAGDTSADLTTNSIAATTGSVLDIAGNTANLSPTSNLANTSAIVIDTTAPAGFTTGAVTVTGGTVVSGWWNSTNTGATVAVPFAVDSSLTGGVMQLQAEADGTFENVGLANEIFVTYLGTSISFPITAAQLEAITGFSEGDGVTFRAIITDIAGNATTGGNSEDTFTVDQTAPTVNAGTDKEVKAASSQDAATSDGGSGLNTHTWSQQAGTGTITFGTGTLVDTTISSDTNGTFGIRLAVTDVAGNSAFDDIQFAWDTIAPILAEVTPVPTPANDTTPNYTFSADSVKQLVASTGGAITYGGTCSSATTNATAGSNTITFNALGDAAHNTCTIAVTDAAGNLSATLNISAFEVDTVVATVATITTTDANNDGMVDTAVIVFSDEVKDSTFVASQFSIGGVAATTFTTGTANDTTVTISHAGVAGTEAKLVTYTPGSATDLAGNSITGFSQTSTDAAKPKLMSARTTSTTTIDATFSENLSGPTINDTGTEFTVAGFAVSAADDGSDDVVTLTVATMPTNATPDVTFTNIGTFKDLNNNEAVTPTMVTAVDGVVPVLTSVSIESDNAKDGTAWAKEGNTVTVAFTASEQLHTNTAVTIGDESATVTDLGSNNWTATLVMDSNDDEGVITFSITFEDIAAPTHNTGTQVTTVTDNTEITYDRTAPAVDAGTTPKYINLAVSTINQTGTASDVAGSGIDTTIWTNTAPTIATSTPYTTLVTALTATADGTYIFTLTAEDNAGNSATDTMTLVRDTISPFVKTYSPTTGKVNVPVTAGIATVTFNETISILDASGATIFKDSDESSVANGTASVSGGNDATAILELPYVTLGTGTIYRFNVNPNAIRDTAGNPFILSFANHFYTVADETAPVIDLPTVTGITATGATLSVTTNEAATCRYSDADEAYGTMVAMTTTGGTLHSVAITGLTADTSYNYYVRCADTSPAVNVTSSTHLPFKTSNVPDVTVPTPIITTAGTTVNSNAYTISGTIDADIPTDGIRTISVYNGGSSAGSASVPFGQTAWSVVVSLTQNATSTFSATASDVAGNVSGSSNTVDIGDADSLDEDSSAPVAPVIDIALDGITVDADTYEIAGTSANDGVRTIVVERNGSPVGTVVLPAGETAWAVTVSLTQNEGNVFTTYAYDEAGNKSLVSNSVTITEAATLDTTAPVITLLGVNPLTLTVGDTYTEYGATASDDIDGDISGSLVTDNSSVNMAVAGTYTVTYNVSDDADNDAVEETRTVIVEAAFDDTATLAVTGINTTKSYATDDDTFPNGWRWTFLVTVPTGETGFAMKFADFKSGVNTISAANNILYYTAQSSTASTTASSVTIAGENTYPGNITLDGDADAGKAGRQIEVIVEMKVPTGSAGGSYSSSYQVQSL